MYVYIKGHAGFMSSAVARPPQMTEPIAPEAEELHRLQDRLAEPWAESEQAVQGGSIGGSTRAMVTPVKGTI